MIGQTGSGKSTLARWLLRSRYDVWVLDVNDALDWHLPDDKYPQGEYLKVSTIEDLLDKQEYPRLIFKPNVEDIDNFDLFNQFFKAAYLAGNLTVYVDEAYAVTNRQTIPFYYKACLTRGRGKGIETWTSSQRPAEIPSFILSESENVYSFRLRFPADLERMERLTEFDKLTIRRLAKQEFCFTNGEIFFRKLKLKL